MLVAYDVVDESTKVSDQTGEAHDPLTLGGPFGGAGLGQFRMFAGPG
jgi:hypothetical protein